MADSSDHYVLCYRADDGFRWKRKAANGEIVSSGEAYTTLSHCIRGAQAANPDIPDARYRVEHEAKA